MKILNVVKILIVSTMVLVMGGCGGGSGNNGDVSGQVDPMTQKQFIIIMRGTPVGECEDPEFKDYLIGSLDGTGAKDFLFREEDNSVNCSTYGKIEGISDTEACIIENAYSGDSTCVIGFNAETEAGGGNYGPYAANLLIGKTFYTNYCQWNSHASYTFTLKTFTHVYEWNPGLGMVYLEEDRPVQYIDNKFIFSTMYYEGFLYDVEYCEVEANNDYRSVLVSCRIMIPAGTITHTFTMWRNIEDADNNPEGC